MLMAARCAATRVWHRLLLVAMVVVVAVLLVVVVAVLLLVVVAVALRRPRQLLHFVAALVGTTTMHSHLPVDKSIAFFCFDGFGLLSSSYFASFLLLSSGVSLPHLVWSVFRFSGTLYGRHYTCPPVSSC
jgi:hypothetical protein